MFLLEDELREEGRALEGDGVEAQVVGGQGLGAGGQLHGGGMELGDDLCVVSTDEPGSERPGGSVGSTKMKRLWNALVPSIGHLLPQLPNHLFSPLVFLRLLCQIAIAVCCLESLAMTSIEESSHVEPTVYTAWPRSGLVLI